MTAAHPSLRRNADDVVTDLYRAHYRALVRLAAMLLHNVGEAEEVVQDSFVAMHGRWDRIKDPDKALAYLRQTVVNRSRSALRHRAVEIKHLPKPAPDGASAEHAALRSEEHLVVRTAIAGLPQRQREAVVLRYYLDLSEADTAATMGISRGAAKSHTSRGMSALRRALGHALEQQS
ncbi:MAG: SigE family RNA polymerase sigma factor [Actinomycetota bacterium]|nr:SigE family RNA polymerase sigma factor [Actinomycetota bacterium]